MINHAISLDMRKRPGTIPQRVTVRRGETKTQRVTATLTTDGAAYTPTYQSARLCVLHADGTWARCAATVGTVSVSATLAPEAVNGTGRCRLAYFEFYSANGASETTEDFALVILGNVDGTTGPAVSYDQELDELYRKWSTELSRLGQSAFDAASAASGAASRADAAASAALQIANAAAQGAAGESDIAELRRQNGQLATMLADATDKFIYMDGTVYCPAGKASVSGDTVTFGSTCSVSGSTVTLS